MTDSTALNIFLASGKQESSLPNLTKTK